MQNNIDTRTIDSFGDEWNRFDQSDLPPSEAQRVFHDYFSVFPWDKLPQDAEGFDMGCGTGRWARFVAPRVGILHCIDPSSALDVARRSLSDLPNVHFHKGSVSDQVLKAFSQDFGYSLGVLHHVPDTADAIRSCVHLLKPGAPLLIYLYYSFDNRPYWYRLIWQFSNIMRLLIYRMPPPTKQIITDMIALFVYLPFARLASVASRLGISVKLFPLGYYRGSSLYTMRTDARDRFGTPLEQRFSRSQITKMCTDAGLVNLKFSPGAPFWCVVGFKGSL